MYEKSEMNRHVEKVEEVREEEVFWPSFFDFFYFAVKYSCFTLAPLSTF
jgi:hypothetical protein